MNTTHALPERPPRRSGLVGPTILIGLGLLFLLNNLGVLSWAIWPEIARLWPLLLIAVGLDLLFGRRSALGSLIAALLVLAALVAAIWWTNSWVGVGAPLASETLTQPLNEAKRASVDIAIGMGELRLGAQSEANGLISGTVAHGPRDQIQRDFAISGDTATFKLHTVRQNGWGPPLQIGNKNELVWDLQLNPEIPLQLDLSTGAGTAVLDLARLNATNLNVSTGVGTTTLNLPQHGSVHANVSGGVGDTTITIPAGVAARISASTGLGQVRITGNFQRQDNLYVSPNYASATDRIDLAIHAGIGSVTVVQELGR